MVQKVLNYTSFPCLVSCLTPFCLNLRFFCAPFLLSVTRTFYRWQLVLQNRKEVVLVTNVCSRVRWCRNRVHFLIRCMHPLRVRKKELNSKFGTDFSNNHNYGHVAAARKLKANSFVPNRKKVENNSKQSWSYSSPVISDDSYTGLKAARD